MKKGNLKEVTNCDNKDCDFNQRQEIVEIVIGAVGENEIN